MAEYDDPDRLRELYHDRGLTQQEVADELGCSRPTIIGRMEKFGIESRDPGGGDPNAPHKDEDTLRELYVEEGLTLDEVADALGTDGGTLRYWMDKFGIERRERWAHTREGPAYYTTNANGYEVWQVRSFGERHQIPVHRLAAVAWFGPEAVAGSDVHHENGVPWDTREENVTALGHGDHARVHAKDSKFWTHREDIDG